MSDRDPAWLVVLIETRELRWYAAAIGSDGQSFPLLRSDAGDLNGYADLPIDEQVSFLRHRLAGVMQRGGDRLYSRQMKVSRFLLIADGVFPTSPGGVTQQLAEHFVQWMMNPPVTFLVVPEDFAIQRDEDFRVIAGEFPPHVVTTLREHLPKLSECRSLSDHWESVVRTQSSDAHP